MNDFAFRPVDVLLALIAAAGLLLAVWLLSARMRLRNLRRERETAELSAQIAAQARDLSSPPESDGPDRSGGGRPIRRRRRLP